MDKNLFTMVMRLSFGMSVGLVLLINGCGGPLAPVRSFTAEDLLLTQELVPASWDKTQIDSVSIAKDGFGNEELDRMVGFVRPDDPEDRVFSSHFVLNLQSNDRAANWYHDNLRREFNDNSIAITEPWATHPDLTFTSDVPDQYTLACAVNNIAGDALVCKFFAQYEEFVVRFSAVIEADTTTVSGFNNLVEEIDNIMATHLQEP